MTWTITIRSDFVVAGHNEEWGELLRERFYLAAENEHGDRRITGSFETPEQAEDAILDAPPVAEWEPSYPVYGSDAFVEYGEDELRAFEEQTRFNG